MSYKSKSNNKKTELNEPMAAYAVQRTMPSFYNLLGSSKSTQLSNDFDIIKLARQGFPKRVLLSLAKKISLNIQELANILHISERTLQRYDDDAIIKTEYAEKAVELARLYTRGEEVFGSMDKFKIWIKTPGHVFKGEAPVTILDTSAGFDMVFKELGRIEHGIFA
ncbi:MAG: putative toxin-antitoxin system antitoxin component, family [Mucilaginibacter sp.]|nr:putative toxin-antitoxin system antitoxin component, family [Mucilaginibacter sp.]